MNNEKLTSSTWGKKVTGNSELTFMGLRCKALRGKGGEGEGIGISGY